MNRLNGWVRRPEAWAVAGVLALAALLRLHDPDLGSFGQDETYTVLLAYDWLDRGVVPLTSLATSFGLPTPPLEVWLATLVLAPGRDLTSMTLLNASLGVAGVAVAYAFTRRWFGARAGLLSGLFSAVMLLLVIDSRRPWDLGLLPLPVIVTTACLFAGAREARAWGWGGAVAGFLILMQINPQALALLPGFGIITLLAWRRIRWNGVAAGLLAGLLPLLPWLWATADAWRGGRLNLTLGAAGAGDGPMAVLFAEALLPPALGRLVNASGGNILPWAALGDWPNLVMLAAFGLAVGAIMMSDWRAAGGPQDWLDQPGTWLFVIVAGGILLFTILPVPVYWHYVIVLLPLVAVIFGVGADRLAASALAAPRGGRLLAATALGVFAALCGLQLASYLVVIDYVGRAGATYGYDVPLRPVRRAIDLAVAAQLRTGATVSYASGKDVERVLPLVARERLRMISTAEDEALALRPDGAAYLVMTSDDQSAAARWLLNTGATALGAAVPYGQPQHVFRVWELPRSPAPDRQGETGFRNGLWLTGGGPPVIEAGRVEGWLGWRVEAPEGPAVKLFVHIVDAEGQRVAQADGFGFRRADWRDGDRGVAFFDAPLADGARWPAEVRAGVYQADGGRRVPTVDGASEVVLARGIAP